jgi:peptidyl-prolyl cis-trans isomerase SurA
MTSGKTPWTARPRATGAIAALLLAAVVGLAAPNPARAQSISVIVNGQAVTDYQIGNRLRLLQLTGNRAATRTTAIDELIEERLKLQEARRLRFTVGEEQVTRQFNTIAERLRLQPDALVRELGRRGINHVTLRDRIRGDLAWQQVIQQRGARLAPVRDQDVVDALRARGQNPDQIRAVEYTLRQVVVFGAAGRGVADRLRGSIAGCDSLPERVRAVRDAAVRDPVRRTSTELPEPARNALASIPVGRASPVSQTQGGWEFLVVCERRDVSGREAATQQMRSELMNRELEEASRLLLAQLRERANIERR